MSSSEGFRQKKAPQGKLLQMEKSAQGYSINGDFFAYPETAIQDLEKILNSSMTEEEKKTAVTQLFASVDIIGFSPNDLWELYHELNA